MNVKYSSDKHWLQLETSLGKDKLILTRIKGTESVSELFNFNLEMFSADFLISAEQLVAKPMSFSIHNEKGVVRYFHGVVNRFYVGPPLFGKGRSYGVEVVPWLWFLSCQIDCRIFQNVSTKEIIEKIFQEFNFKDYTFKNLKNGQTKRQYCVQYHETTLDFLERLLEEEGIYYYFQHQKDKHVLVLSDASSGFASLEEGVVFNQTDFPQAAIYRWEHQYNFGVGKVVKNSYLYKNPGQDLQKNSSTLTKFTDIKKYEHYYYAGSAEMVLDNQAQAKLLMEAQDVKAELIEGSGSYFTFIAGLQFKFNKSEKFSDESYLLLSVEHEAYDMAYLPEDKAGKGYQNHFFCLPSSVNYRPPRVTLKPRIYGLQTAVVVGPEGEEIYTDKEGRIKVKFHWDRRAKENKKEESSCWMRVSQAWAGKGWGMLNIPRVGQEVIISFLEGDLDQPIVIGSVYNGEQIQPYQLPGEATRSGIKTHSLQSAGSEKANELRFEDKKDEEEFYCHAQKDYKKVVEHDETVEIRNNQSVVVKKDRNITVEEGNASTLLQKGNLELTLEKGDFEKTLKSGGRKVKIQGDDVLTIQAGNQTVTVTQGKISWEAMQKIEFKVGQNSLVIDQSGITLKGIQLKIQGTVVNLKADASLKLEGVMVEGNASALLKLQGALTMVN